MIEAGLEFEGSIDRVVLAYADLPAPLRPIYFSHEEKLGSDTDRIVDQRRFAAFVKKSKSGFFLLGPGLTYNLRIAEGKPLICDCFLNICPKGVEDFLKHMSKAKPIFGFACIPSERERRNRVMTQQGSNRIESWVGRDTQRYVPGLYWLTLLPEGLAEKHGVPLSVIGAVAQEHIDLGGGQHFFRFYEQPEDWYETSAVVNLSESLSGIFDVEKVKPRLLAARNFLELNELLLRWK